MRVKQSTIAPSPSRPGYARLSAEVEYDTPGIKPETYWFEVREDYRCFLSDTGNPWLVCLAPLAMALGEPLNICLPVDAKLLAGVIERMRIWKSWYPRLTMVLIEADLLERPVENAGKTFSFFSGGVDAYFTALYYDKTTDPFAKIAIDELVNVWGFDIPYSDRESHEAFMKVFERSAQEMGKELVEVATNLRETQLEKRTSWEKMYLAPALSSVALALEKRYKKALISSSSGYHDSGPDGSSALIDPLSSTGSLRVIHAGAAFSRVQKTEYIAGFSLVQKSLHVCFHIRSEKNCGYCIKCYRTMATLEILGVLPRFKTFPEGAFQLSKAAKVYLWGADDAHMAKDIERLAIQKARPDVAQAVRASFRHSGRVKKLLRLIAPLNGKRFFQGMFWWLEAKILADSVGGEERYYPVPEDSVMALNVSIRVADKFR